MRFLLGLILGALLALTLAGRLDAQATAALEAQWQSLVRSIGTRLFPRPESIVDGQPARTPARDATATPAASAATETRIDATPAQPLAPLPAPAAEPSPTPQRPQRPLPAGGEPTTLEALLAANPLPDDAVPSSADAAPRPAPGTGEAASSAEFDGDLGDRAGGLSPVWSPFHSERSAKGFARHLSDRLQHPFDVTRQGPGRYQVQFAWQDPAQRDALLTAIASDAGVPIAAAPSGEQP